MKITIYSRSTNRPRGIGNIAATITQRYCQCLWVAPKVTRMAAEEILAARLHVDFGRLASALCTAGPA